ncbi:hypothetical protein DYB26_005768, partial [Aphanomyces astaci]
NYANEDEKDYNEDVFTVELIEHADIYRAVNEPSTDDDDDFASLHEEDEWEMVSHELVHYAETTDLDHRITRHSDEAVLNFKHDYCAVNVKDHLSIVAKWNDAYLYSMRGGLILPGDDDEVNTAVKLGAGLWLARMGHIPSEHDDRCR